MSNNGEKSAPNGLATDPQQRLASFKPPRDLTLGGVKPNKKVFTPNLNVARNKNKGPNLNTARDQRRDDKGRRDRKNDKNRNIKNGPNVIKSSGVFSEGLGAAERQSGRFSYGNRDGGNGTPTATLQKPTIRVKDFVKIDKELEEQKIRSVLGHDGGEDEVDGEEYKLPAERDAPIRLPMDLAAWDRAKPKVKQEVVVKAEPDDNDCASKPPAPAAAPAVKKEVLEDNDVVNLLKADQPTLILLQLPDSLPGRGAGDPEPSTSGDSKEEDTPSDGRCRLSELEEGRVGKLRVHASGRVTLALGDTIFEVSAGTKVAFHQEAVCVSTDDGSRSANMVSLGALQHKLNVTPDWETMFHEMPV